MHRKRFLFWSITILALFIFQMTFSSRLSIYGSFPNLLLLATIFFAIHTGPIPGEITGFFSGLLSDASSTSIFGSQTFMLTLIGYITGRLQGKINEEKNIAQMALVLSMSFLYVLGLIFFNVLFGGSAERFKVEISLLQPVYSTLISPLFFLALQKIVFWGRKI